MNPAADLPAHYAIFGELVTHDPLAAGSTTTALAINNRPGRVVQDGQALVTEHTLRYQTASFPAVKQGDVFTIAAVDYLVTEAPLSLIDGAEHVAVLAKKP
jgi:hypothetical protein